MKVLILGSGSFTGRKAITELSKMGYEVSGIQRNRVTKRWLIPDEYEKHINNNIHLCDIRNIDKVQEIIETTTPQVIINFIAQGMVDQSWANPSLWYDTNITRLVNIISRINSELIFIQASTPEVYGNKATNMHKETNTYNPETPYALSKACFDKHLELISDSSRIRVRLTRASNIYGESQELYRLIPRITYSCLKNEVFTLNNGGVAKRNFLYIDDYIKALDKIITQDDKNTTKKKFDIYHLSGKEIVPINEVVKIVCEMHNADYQKIVLDGGNRRHEDDMYSMSFEKAYNELDWEPMINLRRGLHLCSKYYENKLVETTQKDLSYSVKP